MRRVALLCALVLAGLVVAPSAVAEVGLPRGVPPVPGVVTAEFAPPESRWQSGHRGVDLAATPGEVVVAAAGGTVTYASVLAGRGVVVVDHGTVRTTYEPVDASVSVGASVVTGTPLGRVGLGGHCSGTCLHWGLLSGSAYLDPRLLLGVPIRLMSSDEQVAALRTVPGGVGDSGVLVGAGGFVAPAAGPVTSAYGWRTHPLLGTQRFHDGTDFGAPCGSPILAAAGGVVISKALTEAYGNRLLIDHGMVPAVGGRVVTAYNHAEAYGVGVGDLVVAGEQIGTVGTTGWSTGCHLHFSMWVDDVQVDPAVYL